MDETMKAAFGQSLARLNEVGNLSVQQATENSGRLSGMFGIRAAQTNPIEAHAIGKLDQSAAPLNGLATALASALQAAMANLAHNTPNPAVAPKA